VENECTSYNFRLFAIFVPKLSYLVEVWRSYNKNNFACFFPRHGVEIKAKNKNTQLNNEILSNRTEKEKYVRFGHINNWCDRRPLFSPVDEVLAVQVSHCAAQLIAVEHQLHVTKVTMFTMKKLAQLNQTFTIHIMQSADNSFWPGPLRFLGCNCLNSILSNKDNN